LGALIEFPPYFERVVESNARYIGIRGGRGSAKTWSVGGWLVLRHAQDPSENSVCIREVQMTIADSSKALIERKITEYGFSGLFDPKDARIRRIGGGDCIFRGMQNHTSDSIKSLEGRTFAWADEAHKLSTRSIQLLTPTIRAPGSKLVFTWNPEKEDDPVDQFFRENEGDPDFLCITANWDANPWFPDELRRDMERDRKRDPDKYLHVWEGHYRTRSDAQVFRNWRIGEEKPPINAVWHYGADFGFAQDATAGVRCCLIGDTKLYVDAEVYEVGVPTEALPAFFARLPEARQWQMTADNARPETIDYCKRNGLPKMRPTRKGKGSVEDGISFLQGLDIVVHPRCANLARELGSYSYKIDKRTGAILPLVDDGNDHLIDALRYACERLHRKGRLIQAQQDEEPRRGGDYGFMQHEEDAESWKVV